MRQFKVFPAILVLITMYFTSCSGCREGCENGLCLKRVCECDIWWQGNACDKSILSIYEGDYSGNRDCDGQLSNTAFSLEVNPSDPSQMLVSAQYKLQFYTNTRFTVNSLSGDSLGEGEMLLDKISFNTLIIDSVQSTFCLTSAALN